MTRVTALLAVMAFGLPVYAEDMAIDANGDGALTLDEVTAAFEHLTEADFNAADADADGVLNAEEVKVAEEAGMFKAE